jgi:hypothetical protein
VQEHERPAAASPRRDADVVPAADREPLDAEVPRRRRPAAAREEYPRGERERCQSMKRALWLSVLVVAAALAASATARASGIVCPDRMYETAAGCECPAGQHAVDSGTCATDDLTACPYGQFATSSGCVCPAGQHVTLRNECATDTTPAVGTAAVAGPTHTIKHNKKKKHKR